LSASIRFNLSKLEAVNARMGALRTLDKHSLMDAIGFAVENQTRERIQDEKESPAGKPWQAWTARYARTRNGGQSLLQGEGDLLDSLTYDVTDDGEAVDVGSPLVYAAIHQFGGAADMAPGPAAIPARPYLGLSEDNQSEIESVVAHWLDEQIHGAMA